MSIFNYSCFDVTLTKATRNLTVTFKPNLAINIELLFELETLLIWAMPRVEIHSILLTSQGSHFLRGLNSAMLEKSNTELIEKMTRKIQEIAYVIMQMPQTFIADLKKGTENLALELALAADFKIAHQETDLKFDHVHLGLTACSGLTAIIGTHLGHQLVKNWSLDGRKINFYSLMNSGFLMQAYQNHFEQEQMLADILRNISLQAPTARIQTKLASFLCLKDDLELFFKNERQVARANLIGLDFQNPRAFTSASETKKRAKLTLVKTQKDTSSNLN